MTPEQRQIKQLELAIDQARAHVALLKRIALLTQRYTREDLTRQVIGPCDAFVKSIDFVEPEQFGVPGLRPMKMRKTG